MPFTEGNQTESRKITIGGFGHVRAVHLGGNSPVVVQTMWKDRLTDADLDSAAQHIERLGAMGCSLLRFAVPDLAGAEVLGRLAGMVCMPLAADIHFDHTIALRCMDFPVAKIRINPGNIGNKCAVLEKAAGKGVPVRIGVNAGSLPQDLRRRVEQGMSSADALVEAALRELAVCDEYGFTNVIVSMKASQIADTISANRIFSQGSTVPLHIGITEAGPLVAGAVRSSAALSLLLAQGIGDTVRVSLSDSMENEVIAARQICGAAAEIAALDGMERAAGRLKQGGVKVISCPRCGRYGFDTHGFTGRWLSRLYAMDKDITVAVMGCQVNGPQEARHADLGITGAGNKVLIFRRGTIVRTIGADQADSAFEEELSIIENAMGKK